MLFALLALAVTISPARLAPLEPALACAPSTTHTANASTTHTATRQRHIQQRVGIADSNACWLAMDVLAFGITQSKKKGPRLKQTASASPFEGPTKPTEPSPSGFVTPEIRATPKRYAQPPSAWLERVLPSDLRRRPRDSGRAWPRAHGTHRGPGMAPASPCRRLSAGRHLSPTRAWQDAVTTPNRMDARTHGSNES